MSIIRAIKHRLGLSVTPANNFVLDASADNGTMKLARESGQDILIVEASGKLNPVFGLLGFDYSGDGTAGCLQFPAWLGKLSIQWGIATVTAPNANVTLHQAMVDTKYRVVCTPEIGAGQVGMSYGVVYASRTVGQFGISLGAGTYGFSWIVIGNHP